MASAELTFLVEDEGCPDAKDENFLRGEGLDSAVQCKGVDAKLSTLRVLFEETKALSTHFSFVV
eukprot:5505820-Ditylum_brightwellii.AAC.2